MSAVAALLVSTHSRPKAAGYYDLLGAQGSPFQLTAARRRLDKPMPAITSPYGFNSQPPEGGWLHHAAIRRCGMGFNSQPPEGGWLSGWSAKPAQPTFQLTAARRRLGRLHINRHFPGSFNSQPPEGGWHIRATEWT